METTKKTMAEKLDEIDHLLIVLRIINRQDIDYCHKKELQVLVVKQINEILNT